MIPSDGPGYGELVSEVERLRAELAEQKLFADDYCKQMRRLSDKCADLEAAARQDAEEKARLREAMEAISALDNLDVVEAEDGLDEIIQLLEAATPEPWSFKLHSKHQEGILVGPGGEELRKADAKLMAAARNFMTPIIALTKAALKARAALACHPQPDNNGK